MSSAPHTCHKPRRGPPRVPVSPQRIVCPHANVSHAAACNCACTAPVVAKSHAAAHGRPLCFHSLPPEPGLPAARARTAQQRRGTYARQHHSMHRHFCIRDFCDESVKRINYTRCESNARAASRRASHTAAARARTFVTATRTRGHELRVMHHKRVRRARTRL